MMARNVLSSFSRIWRNIFPPSASKPRLVGKDLSGNYYYEANAVEGRHGGRRRRFVTPGPDTDPEDLGTVVPNVPGEWEAWLRGRREAAPSDEELLKIAAMMAVKKARAKELEQKADEERKTLLSEGAIQSEAAETPGGAAGGAVGQFPLRDDMERFPGEGEQAREAFEAERAMKRTEEELREKVARVRKAQSRPEE